MNILIFNVKYSKNVGDGIVAETTEYILKTLSPDAKITTMDIGGRTDYGTTGLRTTSGLKKIMHKILFVLPERISDYIRIFLTQTALKKQIIPRWHDVMSKCDRIIIGGGQLISDTDLYFPIRLHAVIKLAQQLKKPVYIHAVGVSNPDAWRYAGKKLLTGCFKNNHTIKYISVRDTLSQSYWKGAFNSSAVVCPDTGNFACNAYDIKKRTTDNRHIGISVTGTDVLTSHTSFGDKPVFVSVRQYYDLGLSLIDAGYTPCFFTNGATEDNIVLNAVKELSKDNPKIKFFNPPHTASDLVQIIAGCDKIIAHRLHACIVATSLNIPAIGLVWDKKLTSYFESLNAGHHLHFTFDISKIISTLDTLSVIPYDYNINIYDPLIQNN